jgi:hypothetical protein
VKRAHLKQVDLILVNHSNTLILTKSEDSVFVWRISQRVLNNGSTHRELQQMSFGGKMADHDVTSPSKRREIVLWDDLTKFRLARQSKWDNAIELLSMKTPYAPEDLDLYKKEICYYSSFGKIQAPAIALRYKHSIGVNTS